MDYDQDYSRLTATDNQWYDRDTDAHPRSGDGQPPQVTTGNIAAEKLPVVLDDEDFN